MKNFGVFAAVFFTGKIFDAGLLTLSFWAFLSFCAGSSSIYLINDLVDAEKDRLHPFKKNRPLAAGQISTVLALVTFVLLTVLSVYFSLLVSHSFFLVMVGFYVLHLAYSFLLKNIIIIDVMAIATGFILRVFAGEVATGYHLNIWLFLTVISAALVMAIGKRRSELTLLSGWQGAVAAKTRATLSHYSEKMLDVYLSIFANSTWITYAFYTFLERPPVFRRSVSDFVTANDLIFLQDRKFLMATIPVMIYGIMRYLQLIYEKNEGESPEKILLSDGPLLITGVLLIVMLFVIIYVLGK